MSTEKLLIAAISNRADIRLGRPTFLLKHFRLCASSVQPLWLSGEFFSPHTDRTRHSTETVANSSAAASISRCEMLVSESAYPTSSDRSQS